MLPQFGYIVAQAGADSHPPTPSSVPTAPPPPSSSSNAPSPAIIHHLSNSYSLSPSKSNNDFVYTPRHDSPPGNDRNNGMLPPPPPPPPLPYMYSQQQQKQRDSRDDYFNRYAAPPPPPAMPHYQQSLPSLQHPPPYERQQSPQQQQQNPSHYRPLQPLPPIQTSSPADSNRTYSNSDAPWPSSQQNQPHRQALSQPTSQMQMHPHHHSQRPREDSNSSNRLYEPIDTYSAAPRHGTPPPPPPSLHTMTSSTVWRQPLSHSAAPLQQQPLPEASSMQSQPVSQLQHRRTSTPPPRISPSFNGPAQQNGHPSMQQHLRASPTSPSAAALLSKAAPLKTHQSPPHPVITAPSRPRQHQEQQQRPSPPLLSKAKKGHQLMDWQAAGATPVEIMDVVENKMLRKIREFNDLIIWMDTEFWEQCDEIYREKLQSLQDEIKTIQDGTHSVFKETLADIESQREEVINHAEIFKAYELSLTKNQYEHDVTVLESEYETQRHNLHDIVLQAIEEKKKLVKEDKDESDEFINVKGLFKDAYSRIYQKQRLRKRIDHRSAGGHHSIHSGHNQIGHHASSSPSRHESTSSTRRRRDRQTVPHNIHAPFTAAEEEELETDLLTMKGVSPAAAANNSQNSNNTNATHSTHLTSSFSSRRGGGGQQQMASLHQRR